MKLDVNVLRYLGKDEFRTLTAVEMGQKNHEIVPASLVDTIAGLKHGGTFKCLKTLLRHKLVHHDSQKYDGYRLTTLGYDFLAIKTLTNRGSIASVGRQIGVGKEADVFEVADDEGRVMALKLHRLGRTSFRAVKNKRDYVRRGAHYSWLYLSRLAALKEFAFMKALGDAGLPVPEAIECNRHGVLMSMIDACPLVQVRQLHNPGKIYRALMDMLERLAGLGLVHCDYNEFNILISDEEELTLIDFPQMVSVSHANAEELYERDMDGVDRFFARKLGYLPEDDPESATVTRLTFQEAVAVGGGNIDAELRASGFTTKYQEALDKFIHNPGSDEDTSDSGSDSDDDESEGSESGTEDWSEGDSEQASSNGGDDKEKEAAAVEGDNNGTQPRSEENKVGHGIAELDIGGDTDNSNDVSSGEEGTATAPSIAGTAGGTILHPTAQPDATLVQQRMNDQRRAAARRAGMAKASRNAMKGRNKGKRKGEGNAGGSGAGFWD